MANKTYVTFLLMFFTPAPMHVMNMVLLSRSVFILKVTPKKSLRDLSVRTAWGDRGPSRTWSVNKCERV